MAVATINQNFLIPGGAEIYLAPYVGFTGANLAALETSVWATFYTDGAKRRTLSASFLNKQWTVQDDTGLAVKVKPTIVEANLQFGKVPIGIASFDMDIEGVCCDIDVNHLNDIFNGTPGETTLTTAAAGQAGRTTIAFGCQRRFTYYTMLIRLQSGNRIISPGSVYEYDNFIFPRVVLAPEMDFKFTSKEHLKGKFKGNAIPDLTLTSPDSGAPIQMFVDNATAAATS